ncbi:MAG TPA: ABC transporter permease subunit [Sumerlaeia bacterium]|nr:ABC transporter permease subunit [Sumerlaeia bacterium]
MPAGSPLILAAFPGLLEILVVSLVLWLAFRAWQRGREARLRNKRVNGELRRLIASHMSRDPAAPPFSPLGRRAGEFFLRPPAVATLLGKELRTMLRSPRAVWLLGVLMLGASVYFLVFWREHALGATLASRAQLSRMAFAVLYITQFTTLSLISAVMASTVVTVERENKTLDVLYCTRFSRLEILFAKWLSMILYQVILFVGLLPILALTFQLGGVDLVDYIGAAILIAAGIASYGMVGLAFSTYLRRTMNALMASVVATLAIGLAIPAYRIYGFWGIGGWRDPDAGAFGAHFVLYLFFMLAVFAVACVCAWHGLTQTDSTRPTVALHVIKDPRVLRDRRRTWPYYMIDPLARNEEIGDRRNPVFIKEQRVGGLARVDVLIRLGYGAVFASIVLTSAMGFRGDIEAFSFFAKWMVALIALFVPVVSATAISKEREEKTMDLLMSSLVSPRRIVWAKALIPIRFFLALALVSLIFPGLIQVSMHTLYPSWTAGSRLSTPMVALAKVAPMMLAFGVLYAAAGVFCSSLCKRNISAIVSTYLLVLAMMGAPLLVDLLFEMLRGTPTSLARGVALAYEALGRLRDYVCPLISPIHYFGRKVNPLGDFGFGSRDSWASIGLSVCIMAAASVALLELTAQVIGRRIRD